MFERNEAIAEMVENLFGVCGPLKRGQYLAHHQIRAVLDCEPHTLHWQHCMKKLMRRMEDERGITLWSEREVGYKLLTAEEQLTVPSRRQRRAIRQARRGLRSLQSLGDRELSLHQRRAKTAILAKGAETLRTMRSQLRSQALFLRPTPTNPRPTSKAAAS